MALLSVSKDFVVKHGLVVNTTATFLSTANSVDAYTGALIVGGGVGIAQDLHVGGTIYGVVTTATVAKTINTQATATDNLYYPTFVVSNNGNIFPQEEYTTSSFKINPSTGAVTADKLNASAGYFGTATITSPENTVGPETGALVVTGGVGIGVDLHVGGKIYTDGITSTGTVVFSGTGALTPRYSVKIEGGGSGGKLGIRTSGNPDFGIGLSALTSDETGFSPLKFNGSEFHFNIIDGVGNFIQPDAIAVTTSGQVLLTGETVATSTYTGALVVSGGVGIGGDLYVGGNFYAAGVPVLTTSTIVDQFSGGDDIVLHVTTSSGVLTINDVATLQTITNRGNTTNNPIEITNTTESSDPATGALIVSGGVGVSGGLNVLGGIYASSNSEIGLYTPDNLNYVGFKSPTTLTTSTVWKLPATDGVSGDSLRTNGQRELYWAPQDQGSGYPPFPDGDYGLGEAYPVPLSLVDAFGVSLAETFDCMDPTGLIIETDLGVLT